MIRIFLCAYGIVFCWSTAENAEEYLLRLDTIEDRHAAEKTCKATTLRSIEVVAQRNEPFHAKVTFGKETMIFAGKLKPSEHADFSITVHYYYSLDTGMTVREAIDKVVPVLDEHSFRTNLGINVGNPLVAAGSTTVSTKPGRTPVKRNTRYVLHLDKHTPQSRR